MKNSLLFILICLTKRSWSQWNKPFIENVNDKVEIVDINIKIPESPEMQEGEEIGRLSYTGEHRVVIECKEWPYPDTPLFSVESDNVTLVQSAQTNYEDIKIQNTKFTCQFMLDIDDSTYCSSVDECVTRSVSITNVNDEPPRFDTFGSHNFSIKENTASDIVMISATDPEFDSEMKEKYTIYMKHHLANKHKMISIPLCKIPNELKS